MSQGAIMQKKGELTTKAHAEIYQVLRRMHMMIWRDEEVKKSTSTIEEIRGGGVFACC
jgi:hypothetical protein